MKADNSSMKYLGLGVELGIVMTLPVYLGHLADARWDSAPYGLSFGLIIGIGGLIKSVSRVMKDYQATLKAMQPQPEQRTSGAKDTDLDA
jgi:F0F1-type ATP synthase assembly protein I